jgi:adenylate cyclase
VVALITSGVIAGALVALSRKHLKWIAAPDHITYDWRTALLSKTAPSTRPDITLLLISDRTLAQYSYQMPADRGLLAQIVRTLDAEGAKVIALDIILDRKTDKDKQLIDAISSSRARIVLGEIGYRLKGVERTNMDFQRDFFKQAGNPPTGHLYLLNEHPSGLGQPDQVVRYLPEHISLPDHILVGFAEAIAEASGHHVKTTSDEFISWLKPRTENGAETFYALEIPSHKPDSLTADMIVPPEARDRIRNKIVLVGGNFEDRDRHSTPMSVVDGAQVPGVLIQAQILAQLLDDRIIRQLSVAQEFAIAFLLALFGFIGGRALRFQYHQSTIYLVSVACLVIAGFVLFSYGFALPSESCFFSLIVGIFVGHYSQRIIRKVQTL